MNEPPDIDQVSTRAQANEETLLGENLGIIEYSRFLSAEIQQNEPQQIMNPALIA